MLECKMPPETVLRSASVRADIERACLLIPPCWDLRSFVAVNPFMSYASLPIDIAASAMQDGIGAQMLPPTSYYRACWRDGGISMDDVTAAARRTGTAADSLLDILERRAVPPKRRRIANTTSAECIDHREGSRWNAVVCDALARWCEHECAGKSGCSVTDGLDVRADPRPFARWRRFASIDRAIDAAGLAGFRAAIAEMPDDPDAAIECALAEVGIDFLEREAYLLRLLAGIYGWACQARRVAWERDPGDPGAVRDLLAARACADAAVSRLARRSRSDDSSPTSPACQVEDERTRIALQEAVEDGYVRGVISRLRSPGAPEAGRPRMQAVFCIDVRSEPLRRHLEAQSPDIETRGFAGFFGIAMEWSDEGTNSARCPVLLKPACSVHGATQRAGVAGHVVDRLHSAPASSFASVELAGIAYGAWIAVQEACLGTAGRAEERSAFDVHAPEPFAGIPFDVQVRTADSILRGMSVRSVFAPLVLLCGHAASSANNPHASSLDCGACGGHGGAPNARVACAILNDPRVREELRGRGWPIPDDTVFVPAVHDTSDDSVRILDPDRIPASHADALARAVMQLASAGAAVRAERGPSLGISHDADAPSLLRALRRRARDWAQVRPEWGLAGNAAFIAARRARTRAVDLEGRAFLHEYDHQLDADGALLDLILSAPMVVASWINLQYLASTLDNDVLGAGDKALHNRVGNIGVVVGNGGDLRTGLPLQSVESADGRWRHEPLRLQVMVEAPTERIDAVLHVRRHVRELVGNGWVRLFALDPQGGATMRFVPGEGWELA